MGHVIVSDKEEIGFLNKELTQLGLEFPDFLLSIILRLHWKFLATKGMAPEDKKFDNVLKKLKKKTKEGLK